MKICISFAAAMLAAGSAAAQTTVTTTGGTATSLPKYSDTAAVVPSIVSDSNNVMSVSSDGFIGVEISPNEAGGYSQLIGGKAGAGGHLAFQANSVTDSSTTGGTIFLGGSRRGDARAAKVYLNGNAGSALPNTAGLMVDVYGNTGLGLSWDANPRARLEVNGDILLSGSDPGIRFSDGTVLRSATGGSGTSFNTTTGTAVVSGVLNIQGLVSPTTTPQGAYLGWNALTGGTGETDFINSQGSGPGGFAFMKDNGDGTRTTLDFIDGSGNLGLGTTSPGAKLQVNGDILLSGTNPGIRFVDGSILRSATATSAANANLGVRTSTPTGALDVAGAGGLVVTGANLDPAFGYSLASLQNSAKVLTGWNESGGRGETDFITNSGPGAPGGFTFYNYTNDGVLTSLFTAVGTGNIGIGTDNPGAKLEVNGNMQISGQGNGIRFPDGSIQTVAWNGSLCGGDYAESVNVGADRKTYEPGDVIVIDPIHAGSFTRSTTPYSKLVAGVYSTKPGLTGRRQPASQSKEDEIPMAVVGIVPTKVSTINGPIEPGDLLVTSEIAGVAMRASDDKLRPGLAIGKAMASLNSGTGLIEVLVSLQ